MILIELYTHFRNKRIIAAFLMLFLLIGCLKQISGQKEAIKNKVTTVVIDAGHGGKDPGAKGHNTYEKYITLALALKTGKYIEEHLQDVEVIYTRKTDVFIPLHERAEIANRNDADLFISIHVNANSNTKAYGTETFAMGSHKIESNLDVAKRENSVIAFEEDYTTRYEGFDPNSPESYIMFSLLQNTYLDQSLTFASYVQDQFKNRAKRHDRGVKQAGFLVLWKSSMPRVLIEAGFITNPREEQYLMSERGQDIIASAIFRAFRDYKKAIETRSKFAVNGEKSKNEPAQSTIQPVITKEVKDTSFNEGIEGKDVTPHVKVENLKEFSKNEQPDQRNIPNEEITFKVQISSSVQKIEPGADFFQGLPEIEIIESAGMYKYLIGKETSYDNIKSYCDQVKIKFPDAFPVAFKNGKIISINEAVQEHKN